MDDDRTRAGGWLAVRLQEKSYPSLAPVTKLRQSPNMATVSRATGPSRRVSLRDAQTWSARPAADTSAAAHTSATAWIDFRVGGICTFPLSFGCEPTCTAIAGVFVAVRGRALFLWPLSLSCPALKRNSSAAAFPRVARGLTGLAFSHVRGVLADTREVRPRWRASALAGGSTLKPPALAGGPIGALGLSSLRARPMTSIGVLEPSSLRAHAMAAGSR